MLGHVAAGCNFEEPDPFFSERPRKQGSIMRPLHSVQSKALQDPPSRYWVHIKQYVEQQKEYVGLLTILWQVSSAVMQKNTS